MSKILVTSDATWYDELNSVAYYGETEFERSIKQHLNNIFPDYYAFSYKQTISDGPQRNRADLALLRRDYGEWGIIEVELGSDNFNHVKKQIQTFVNGDYNAFSMLNYIERKAKEELGIKIDRKKTLKLISNNAPIVMVMVDEEKKEWIDDIEGMGAKVFVFQVYKNVHGLELYRLNGEYPTIIHEESHCKYHKDIPNLLEIKNPRVINHTPDEVRVIFNQRLTLWKKFTNKNVTYLRFIGMANPLSTRSTFRLYKDSTGKLHFQIN